MLTLSRRYGEQLLIVPDHDLPPGLTVEELFAAGPITIQVVQGGRVDQVRLRIDAPRLLVIERPEASCRSR